MAQAVTTIARRSLLAAAAILPTLAAVRVAHGGEPILALRRQRDAVRAEIEAVPIDDDRYDAEVERLSDLHDALGARMIDFPIRSAADARAKLSIIDELYQNPMHANGHDRALFDQVLAWLDAASGFA